LSRKEASTGTTVSDSSSEPDSAKTMVSATGREQLAFQPLQRQQRQEHDDDDERCPRPPAAVTSRTAR
jgi:hypothetical protein